jgi:hypothetical protein
MPAIHSASSLTVSGKLFHPCQIFELEAGTLPNEVVLHLGRFLHYQKDYTKLEMFTGAKHASLFCKSNFWALVQKISQNFISFFNCHKQ